MAIEVAKSIFDRAGRDFESMGLATIELSGKTELALGVPEKEGKAIVANILRILGYSKFINQHKTRTQETLPNIIKKYLEKLCPILNREIDEFSVAVKDLLISRGVISSHWLLLQINSVLAT